MSIFGSKSSSRNAPVYSRSNELNQLFPQLFQQMNTTNSQTNPYLAKMNSWYDTVSDPNYSAYSQDYLNNQYETKKNDLTSMWQANEDKFANRLGDAGLHGTTYANSKWQDDVITPENTQLANLKNDIWNSAEEATRKDKQTAISMLPTASNLYTSNQQQPFNNMLSLAQLLMSENASRNGQAMQTYQSNLQNQQANNNALGNLLGNAMQILPYFL